MSRLSLASAALAAAALLLPHAVLAHGTHSVQPPSIIDPLVTHHAVLEDELKLNLSGARGSTGASFEIAWAFTDLVGVELFLSLATEAGDGRTSVTGFGDLVLQLPKISFVRERGLVLTTYLGVVAPTATGGLGENRWIFAPHLLADVALDERWGLQSNAALEFGSDGEVAAELRASLAATFALDEQAALLLSPLVELGTDVPLRGEEELALELVPGVKLGLGGWHLGAGVVVPLRGAGGGVRAILQAGYHVNWGLLVGG